MKGRKVLDAEPAPIGFHTGVARNDTNLSCLIYCLRTCSRTHMNCDFCQHREECVGLYDEWLNRGRSGVHYMKDEELMNMLATLSQFWGNPLK